MTGEVKLTLLPPVGSGAEAHVMVNKAAFGWERLTSCKVPFFCKNNVFSPSCYPAARGARTGLTSGPSASTPGGGGRLLRRQLLCHRGGGIPRGVVPARGVINPCAQCHSGEINWQTIGLCTKLFLRRFFSPLICSAAILWTFCTILPYWDVLCLVTFLGKIACAMHEIILLKDICTVNNRGNGRGGKQGKVSKS